MIDSHAHLSDIKDLQAVLIRAGQSSVSGIVAVGVDLDSSKRVLEIAQQFKNCHECPDIYPAIGIHPGNLKGLELDEAFSFLEQNIQKATALGEMGLDYWYKEARDKGPGRDLQKKVFAGQLQLAARFNKPVTVHSRAAWDDCLQAVIGAGVKRAVFHWYCGPVNVLEEILEQGYFISVTPAVEYSKELKQAVARAPLGKILIETDSPVMYKPESGKYESEPADVCRVLKVVAEIKGVDIGRVSAQTDKNVRELFNI